MIPTFIKLHNANQTPIFNRSTTLSPIITSNDITSVETVQHIPLILTVILEIIIFIIALIGNSIVVLVVVKKRRMQTFTNWLILNLAIADLSTVLICIPLEIPLEINPDYWPYGEGFCRIFYPLQTSSIYGSVFTLVGLCLSRYWAVVHPFRKQPTVKMAKVLIAVIWASSIAVVIPYVLILDYDSNNQTCQETWTNEQRRKYTIALFVFQYVLPLAMITMAYAYIIYDLKYRKREMKNRSKDVNKGLETKRVIKLLIVVTVTFAVSILPYQLVALGYEFGNAAEFEYIEDVSILSFIVLYLNAALNPILYNVFSSKFREAFTELYKTLRSYASGSTAELAGAGFFSSRRPSVYLDSSRRWSRHSAFTENNNNVNKIKEQLLNPQYLSPDSCTRYSAVKTEFVEKSKNGFINKKLPIDHV